MTDVTFNIAAGADDGRCYQAGGGFANGTTDIDIGSANVGGSQACFFRFQNVTIPAGATIESAVIRFIASGSYSGTVVNVKVHMEAADDPAAPSDDSDLLGRSLTTGVSWSSIPSWSYASSYDSVDISSEVQAVVDRGGWASGQAMTVHIRDNGSTANQERRLASYNHSTLTEPQLVITYSTPITGSIAESFSVDDTIDGELPGVGEIADSFSVNEYIDAKLITPKIIETFGVGDTINASIEALGDISESIGFDETIEGFIELSSDIADSFGVDEQIDAFHYSEWIRLNRTIAKARYYCTLTGAAALLSDAVIPISSIYARKEYDGTTFVQVVCPFAYQSQIADRANGTIKIDVGFEVNGAISLRETIIEVDIEEIRPDVGAENRSITISGRRAISYAGQSVILNIEESNYYSVQSKAKVYRFVTVDPYLNPGDTVTVDGESFTIKSVVYIIGDNRSSMEIREGAI